MTPKDKQYIEKLKHHRRIIWVSSNELIGMFLGAAVALGKISTSKMMMKLPVISDENLPENILFDHVIYDQARMCFGIVIIHESFDYLEEFEMPMSVNGKLNSIIVDVEVTGRQYLDGKVKILQ